MTNTPTIAAQFLEYNPKGQTPASIRERLRQAFDHVPINILAIGWNLPMRVEDAIASECALHKTMLYRWQPLLASDTGFALPEAWRTIGFSGKPISGYKNLPEFTFVCPNRPDVQHWMFERIDASIQRGIYHGIFFDRMRFPSPAPALDDNLACFCPYCRKLAIDTGVDIEATHRLITEMLYSVESAAVFLARLFAIKAGSSPTIDPLEAFLDFRANSISRFLTAADRLLDSEGLESGLDCFSPTLSRMVGQDLSELGKLGWVKTMIYPHTQGPAGLPYELLGVAKWLKSRYEISESETLNLLQKATRLPLPANFSKLASYGLPPVVITNEINQARNLGVKKHYPGLSLINSPGLNGLDDGLMVEDLTACRASSPDGVVLSWDLWHITREQLSLFRKTYLE